MPAPAVIPTPQAYTNVAVVKTFVVNISAHLCGSDRGTLMLGGFPRDQGSALRGGWPRSLRRATAVFGRHRGSYKWVRSTTVNKSACSKQALGCLRAALCLNVLAWNCNNLTARSTMWNRKQTEDASILVLEVKFEKYQKTNRREGGVVQGVSVDQERESRDRR